MQYFETTFSADDTGKSMKLDHQNARRFVGKDRNEQPYVFGTTHQDGKTKYLLRSERPINEQSMACMRSFAQDQSVTFYVKWIPQKKIGTGYGDQKKNVETVLKPIDYGVFIQSMLERKGLELREFRVLNHEEREFDHQNNTRVYRLPVITVYCQAVIKNLDAWHKAFLRGMGPNKTYGLGMPVLCEPIVNTVQYGVAS